MPTEATTSPVDARVDGLAGRSPAARTGAVIRTGAPAILLVALALAFGFAEPSFLSWESLRALMADSAVILLLAAGETFPIITGRIDLSIAAFASLTTVLMAVLIGSVGWLAVPIVVVIITAAGVIQGLIHAKVQLPSFIVTMAGMTIAIGLALIFSDAKAVPIARSANPLWWMRGEETTFVVPNSLVFSLILVAVAALVLNRFVVGRWVYALGIAERAGLMAGVPVGLVILFAFGASAFFASMAGAVFVADFNAGRPALVDVLLLPAIAAVVVGGTPISGGTGGMWRTVVGTFTIAVLRVGLPAIGAPPQFRDMLYGAIVLIGVALTTDRSKFQVVK